MGGHDRRGSVSKLGILAAVMLIGCGSSQEPAKKPLTLATTTSTRDSGLLDVLRPMFEQETGIRLKVVAVGSGQALELGRRGDADVLLTHAAEAEEKFMAEGHGAQRQGVMHNDFVLVGPKADPAKIKGEKSITAAVGRIAESKSPFVSRGDNSGTHMKERKLWDAAVLKSQGDWYIEAGDGMAAVLRMASEKRAYTLSDCGTFLAQRGRLDLTILSQGDPLLHNPYTVIVVSPEKHPGVNHQAAKRFAEFLLSEKVQAIIAEFGIERFGQSLFFARDPPESNQRSRSSRLIRPGTSSRIVSW